MNRNKHPIPSLLCLDRMMASSSADAGNWMATAHHPEGNNAFGIANGMSSMDAIQLAALQQCLLSSSSPRQDTAASALQVSPLLLQQLLLSSQQNFDSPLLARTVLEAPPLLLPKGGGNSKTDVVVSTNQQTRRHDSASCPRPCDKKYTGALGQVRCQAITTRRKECAFVVARPGATHCHLHSCSTKTTPPQPKRPRRKGHVPVTHGVLLSQLASSQWKGRQVRVHAGPFAGRTARVRTWGNGWVTIALDDVLPGVVVMTNKDHHRRPLLHNRRAYDLSVVAEVEHDNQEEKQEDGLHSSKRRRLERDEPSSILVPPNIQKDSPLKSAVDSPKGVMHLAMPPSLFSQHQVLPKNDDTGTPKSVSDSSQSGSSVETSLPSDNAGPVCLEAKNPEDEVHRSVHQVPLAASSPTSSFPKSLVPVVSPEPSEDLSSVDAAAATVVPLPTLPTSNKQNMGKFEMLCMISSLAFVPGQDNDDKEKKKK